MACFSPFGSLTEGIDGEALSRAMVAWVDAEDDQPTLAGELVGLVWSATTDQISEIRFGRWGVRLITPTSQTTIRLWRRGGYNYLEVDFGPKGSEVRSLTILGAAEMAGVRFEAYAEQGRVERHEVLETLLEQTEQYLAWLNSDHCSRADWYRQQSIAKASAEKERFMAELVEF